MKQKECIVENKKIAIELVPYREAILIFWQEKILIFQNNYSRLLGILQNNSIDFVDEDDFYLNTKKKIIEQLRQY